MKRNSWHYKLAKIGNDNNTIWDISICEYIRKVFWGGILFLFMTALLCVVVGWLGMGLYEIVGSVAGFSTLGPAAYVIFGLLALIGFGVGSYHAKQAWQKKSKDLLKKDNKSFVSTAYKSYKDKICFRVEFDE